MGGGAELRIGELAVLAGVSTRMIRHYHRSAVLPEPVRGSNGYRRYGVRDVVLLLRVRQLIELGLNLDEVRDALAESSGREMREMLTELDADLARQQQRIAQRRARLAALMAPAEHVDRPADKEAVLGELAQVAEIDRTVLDRERLAAEVIEASVDPALTPEVWHTFHNLLDDRDSARALLEISRRFDALAGLDAHDPAVDSLADEAGRLGDTVLALLPCEVRDQPGDPGAADRLLRVMQVSMDLAQARCLELMFAAWRARS